MWGWLNSHAVEKRPRAEHERAAVWEIDTKTGKLEYTASGLRNPWLGLGPKATLCGLPSTNATVGHQVPPDYMTASARAEVSTAAV